MNLNYSREKNQQTLNKIIFFVNAQVAVLYNKRKYFFLSIKIFYICVNHKKPAIEGILIIKTNINAFVLPH